MTDPLGLIGNTSSIRPGQVPPKDSAAQDPNAPSFRDLLQDQIKQVNDLQNDAKEAVEDLVTGKRDDLEGVILATQKADTAFRMLLQVRNKVMNAYDEVKQMRV